MQDVAALFEELHIGPHLRRRGLFVDPEPTLAGQPDRHRRQAIVVAGNAAGVRGELGVRALQRRKAGLNRISAGLNHISAVLNHIPDCVAVSRLQRHGSNGRAFRAGLQQRLDNRRVSVLSRDIQHAPTRIAPLGVAVFGVHVGPAFNQQVHDVQRKGIGDRGVHQRRPAQRIEGIHIGAMIQQQPDGFDVANVSDVLQRQRVMAFVGNLRRQQVQACCAFRRDGHREPHVLGGFGVRTVPQQQFHDCRVAGRKGFDQR